MFAGCTDSKEVSATTVKINASTDLSEGLVGRITFAQGGAAGEREEQIEPGATGGREALIQYLRGSSGDLYLHLENNGRNFYDAMSLQYDLNCVLEGISADEATVLELEVRTKDTIFLTQTLSPGQELDQDIILCEPPRSVFDSKFRGGYNGRVIKSIVGNATILSSNHEPIDLSLQIHRPKVANYVIMPEGKETGAVNRICVFESATKECQLPMSRGIVVLDSPINPYIQNSPVWYPEAPMDPFIVEKAPWNVTFPSERISLITMASSTVSIFDGCLDRQDNFDTVYLCGLPGTDYLVEGSISLGRNGIYDCLHIEIRNGSANVQLADGSNSHRLTETTTACTDDIFGDGLQHENWKIKTSNDFVGSFWLDFRNS